EVRRFVSAGGTAVLATDAGLLDRPLLDMFDVHVAGALGPGEYPIGGIAFSDPPASKVSLDRGVTLTLGPGRVPLASALGRAFVGMAPAGRGALIVVGTVAPFLNGQLGIADNGRFALALALSEGRSVAFDEYHHGYHPTDDALVLLERTWPGRALVLAAVAIFLYLVLTGRHLGLPIPLDPRPPRSSLEYIRGFAGLVRRSGHDEAVHLSFIALVLRGHLLIEGVPGTAKTLLARTIARLVGGTFKRIQFTPDLMPSDIVGTSIYEISTSSFRIRTGPIFANIVLAD